MSSRLNGRSRNKNGMFRLKRLDTRVGTIEAQYNIDLGMRSDAYLETAFARYGVWTVKELVEIARKRK